MPVLMPTQQLWKQLGAPHALIELPPSADCVLGDWLLKPAIVRRRRFTVAVNERTLMAIVFAKRPLARLAHTMAICVGAQLEVFGIPDVRIEAEVAAFESVSFGKTHSRQLLGTLNEVAFTFEAFAADAELASPEELLAIQTKLNEMPHRSSSRSPIWACDAIEAALGHKTLH
jgi:hypothetical protein